VNARMRGPSRHLWQRQEERPGIDFLLGVRAREAVALLHPLHQLVAGAGNLFHVVLGEMEPVPSCTLLQIRPTIGDLLPLHDDPRAICVIERSYCAIRSGRRFGSKAAIRGQYWVAGSHAWQVTARAPSVREVPWLRDPPPTSPLSPAASWPATGRCWRAPSRS